MIPRVEYRFIENEAQRKQIEKALAPSLGLFPFWVKRVELARGNEPDGDETRAAYLQPEYRTAQVTIYPAFFSRSEQNQRHSIRHEIIRALLGRLLVWVRESLLDFVKEHNEELHDHLNDDFTKEIESLTEELLYIYGEALGVAETAGVATEGHDEALDAG